MSWQAQINPNTAVWDGVVGYADARIADLAGVCTNPEASDADIRRAQAGIMELQRLKAVPAMIAAQGQIRAAQGARKEY